VKNAPRVKLLCQFLAVTLMGAAAGTGAARDSADVALRAAIQTEVVDGDLQGAIRQYEAIASGGNRAAAALALLRMGRCYERLGEANARQAYERVVRQFADQKEAAREAGARLAAMPGAQEKPVTVVGWYNGDWQQGIPSPANWYRSTQDFARVYDDFVVPAGGWTVVGVFSNSRMDFANVTTASWEIRRGMSPGKGGTLAASGVSPATQTAIRGNGPFPNDPMAAYRIQVDGLRVQLAPGRYWLSVAPIGWGESYLSATRGRNAVGDPRGGNGLALVDSPIAGLLFQDAKSIGRSGQLGIGTDFSQGVLILKTSK
jgi:hypothetical protein